MRKQNPSTATPLTSEDGHALLSLNHKQAEETSASALALQLQRRQTMRAHMRYFGTIVVVALALLSATLTQGSDKTARTHTVLIKGFAFVPDHLTVSAGDTVVWKNEDIVPHTATGDGAFDSKEIGSTKSWTYKAMRKGKFPYICTYHPTMHAELTVQ